jgi:serine/threonine-protein kinase RsbW
MQTSSPDGPAEVVIASDHGESRSIQEMIISQLRQFGFDDKEIFGIRLSLEEAFVNAIKHGNRMDQSKKIRLRFNVGPDRFEIAITDEGNGYDPTAVPDPLADENLERPNGRGLFLMKHYMTEVTVHPPGNHVTMCKIRRHAQSNRSSRDC